MCHERFQPSSVRRCLCRLLIKEHRHRHVDWFQRMEQSLYLTPVTPVADCPTANINNITGYNSCIRSRAINDNVHHQYNIGEARIFWRGCTRHGHGLGWVGSSSVKYDSLPKSTALVNIARVLPITFIFRIISCTSQCFSGFVCPSPAKKARRDPFADTRDGNPHN